MHPSQAHTPGNSPSTHSIDAATPTLSPSSTASHSSVPDVVEAESDLSQYLVHFPVEWNVRKERSPAGLPRSGCLRALAFMSNRTSVVVHFAPSPSGSDDWAVTISELRPLTVGDIATRIGEELYREDNGDGIYAGHPREDAARAERRTRLMGELDERNDRFRAIDLYPRRRSHFLGLDEVMSEDGSDRCKYVVRLGRPDF